ncbi:hypothetical protein KI688_004240 [Linnemannia hyalina]|uniref:rhizopuspepsin n=1 Tax=Linnemannia hyalina TaxID=64524 RepID=A0A9P7XNH8_9FUNG|nr:hypothetical protein KI688_004240 [Linnemannia hyalina]
MKRLSLILAVAIHAAYAGTVVIPLTNHDNVLWYGNIAVGSPGNTFTVAFDTGSADLFLPGKGCSKNCNGHTAYDPNISSTSSDLGKSFKLTFEEGEVVSGEEFTDTVSIGGLVAAHQTVGVAAEYPSSLGNDQFFADGILGLAFESISTFGASPVMQSLISQGQLDEPVFSFKLAASGSELFMGGANSALYTGDFTYTSLTQQGFWEVMVEKIEGKGQTIFSNIDAIIDTGTTLTVLPLNEAAQFYKVLGGTDASSTLGPGFYTFPCDSFPSVSFTFGGRSFPMSKATLDLGAVSQGSSDCVSSIIGRDTGVSYAIIGTSFLQNVYTSFDIGHSRIGFAQLA